jgi:hypothetical protein
MGNNLHYNSVTPYLLQVLKQLMLSKEFERFRLVGGTSLSLQVGHRISIDIDLFTDAEYNSLDFSVFDNYLIKNFAKVETDKIGEIGFGKSYFIGENDVNTVKLDIYYTDEFIKPCKIIDGIRFASIEDIIAMKLDVISRGEVSSL